MRLGGSNAGADLFMDQFPLELRYGCENVHQEFAGRIRLVRIDTLRGGNEANPNARQFLNPGDAMCEGAPEAWRVEESTATLTDNRNAFRFPVCPWSTA